MLLEVFPVTTEAQSISESAYDLLLASRPITLILILTALTRLMKARAKDLIAL